MAKAKTKPYRVREGRIVHDGKEYNGNDTIELTVEQAALLNVESIDKTAPDKGPGDLPLDGDPSKTSDEKANTEQDTVQE
jgi:hypothetical protein